MGKVLSKNPPAAKFKSADSARIKHAVDVLDALPPRERHRVMEIYRQREADQRNAALSRSIAKAEEEYKDGTMLSGSMDDVLKALNHD